MPRPRVFTDLNLNGTTPARAQPRIGEWGPVGTPDDIAEWFQTFIDAGVDYFICRFGSLDQFGQVERFARDVLPRFAPVTAATIA